MAKRKLNKRGKRRKAEGKILKLLVSKPEDSFSFDQIYKKLGKKERKDALDDALNRLCKIGKVKMDPDEKYRLDQHGKGERKSKDTVVGFMDVNRKGNGYLVSEKLKLDVFVALVDMNRAMDGDKVVVEIFGYRKNGAPKGKVLEILERKRSRFVAQLEVTKKVAFALPLKVNMSQDIFIPLDKLKGGETGDRVIVEITEWPSHAKNPIGRVTKVFGEEGRNEMEMQTILTENGFEEEFPSKVLEAAKRIEFKLDKAELSKRRDFREVTTFTIDPVDAKDFDDALSYRKTPKGLHEIGIHIADVAHYVQPGSALDREAQKRATSVYLVDRVAPMLPEVLSNGVCSLRPNEDKFTFSAVFELDEEWNIKREWFGRTVTHSDRRFTYEEAQEILDAGKGEFHEELDLLDQFSKHLRAKRFENGAVKFESKEVRFTLDENQAPVDVITKVRKDSNMLVEDLMLLANKSVAGYFGKVERGGKKKGAAFVYRVHDDPDMDRLKNFGLIAKAFGHKADFQTPRQASGEINRLLSKVAGQPEEYLFSGLAIRSMAKAEYTIDNIGHYGLAFTYYSHFTSPIRRYPDILVHRLLQMLLENGEPIKKEELRFLCDHSSKKERDAERAERESKKYKQVEYLSSRVGQSFDGVVSGLSAKGFWVELSANYCEGFVPLDELEYDNWRFDEALMTLTGQRSGVQIQFGQKIRVEVLSVDLDTRRVELAPATDNQDEEE